MRYVGWTTNPKKRLALHLKQATRGYDTTRCGNWKRSLLREGVTPTLTVVEEGEGPGWAAAEVRWVAHCRALSGELLTNLTEGGEGALGVTRSPETRAKMGAASRGRKHSEEVKALLRAQRLGSKAADEVRARMSVAHQGKTKTPDVIEKSAAFWRGRKHSDATKEKIRASHGSSREVAKPKRSEKSRSKTSASLKEHYANQGGGRKMSEEAKEKIRQAVKAYRARVKSVASD